MPYPQPFFLLNKEKVPYSKDSKEYKAINEVYTDNFEFADMIVKFDKCKSAQDIQTLLETVSRCHKITIPNSLINVSLEQIRTISSIKTPNLSSLSISGNKDLSTELLRIFCKENSI